MVGVIVDGNNRHLMTPGLEDKRGIHTAKTDPVKKSPYTPERDDKTQEEETNDATYDSVL